MELYSEGAEKSNYSEITVDKIIPRLKQNYGYTDENLHTQILGTVELTVPEEGNIEMATASSKEVRVVTSDDNTKNYVKLDGMWYEFNITGDQVTVGEGNKEIPGESENVNSSQLQVTSNNEDVTVSASTGTFIVTITSNENPTPQNQPAVITVFYGGSKIEINVTVKQAYTLTVNSNNEEYGAVSVSPTSENNKYIAGTEVTVKATPGEDNIFKGWYAGNNVADETKLLSDEYEYTIELNEDMTLTAKFVDVDNSNSYAEGFVDYLGTRATIYLYANASKIKYGTITVTMPDNTEKTITATSNNTNIGPNTDTTQYYDTYTVSKDGIYSFQVRNNANNQTTTTIIKVKGIEKFTSIESLAQSQNLSSEDSGTKSYNYRGAAVPKGYYVDTNSTVADGLVITDSVDAQGYSTGNEWVWVPVNNTVGNDDYYGTELYETVLAGTEDVTYTRYGNLYTFVDTERENYGTFHPYGTGNGTLGRPSTPSTYQKSGFREIAILKDSANGLIEKYDLVNNRITGEKFTNLKDVAIQYRDDFNSMVTSVDKYHGFYIGRYEITENGEKPGDSLAEDWNWYTLYNICLTLGKEDKDNVKITESSMMYGTLWDATMQWLASFGISVGYTTNSINKYGNYNSENVIVSHTKDIKNSTINVKAIGASVKLQTGQTSYTRIKNIFDLSGNFNEWTQEGGDYSSSRSWRGGSYYNQDSTKNNMSSRNGSDPITKWNYVSSRAQLYIK